MKREDQYSAEVVTPVDEIAAEFLRAQEITVPATIGELRQATESATAEVEQLFGNFDELRAMKEDDSAGEISSPESYDSWIDASLDLDSAFLDEGNGALGRTLIELATLDDAAFEVRQDEAKRLLQQTGNIALRMYPSIHRLVTLGFGMNRVDVLEKLSAGDLVRQERVHDISVTPRRRTIIGLLRDLDARLPEDERMNIWMLEVAPELPSAIVVSDPFQSRDDDLLGYWRQRIGTAKEVYGTDATILSLSGDKTTTVLWELENIVEHAADDVLRSAAHRVAEWLEGKRIYYQDPDPRDFELYHLGMEDPVTLMEIMRALDVIKHFDQELFFELLGIDPSLGGRSPYFGSFLHKAMYNTQRAVAAAGPEFGTMAIQTMMNQLLTVDDHVQTYAAVVSQESLKAMAEEIKKSVDSAATPESKAQTLLMLAVPYSRMAIDAEVRRQLDVLREAGSENIVEELRRRIDDIEHPLKLADYLMNLPIHAVDDVMVRRELRKILSDEQIDAGTFRSTVAHEYCTFDGGGFAFDVSSILPELYERIPLIDESREDLGFALRVRVAIRDAVAFADNTEEIRIKSQSEQTRARRFLRAIMFDNLYQEDFEVVKDGLGFLERRIAERFHYASRSFEGNYSGIMKSTEIYIGSTWSTEDKAFFIGQALVGWETKARDRRYDFSHQLLEMAKEHRPDLVFLSVVAHPQGKEVAFKYFSEFCDMIPAERMCEILKLHSDRLREFIEMFEQHELPIVKDYVRYLRRDLPYERGQLMNKHFVNRLESKHVEPLRRINRAFVEGKTPWTRKVQIEAPNSHGNMGFVSSTIDAWEIWGLLDDKTLNPFVIDAIDPDAWNEATAFENLYRGLSVSGLTKRLAEYFRLEAEHTIIELMSSPWRNMAIAGYVARKRDEESVNAYRR